MRRVLAAVLAAVIAWPAMAAEADFAAYPAKLYAGKTVLPDFDGAARAFRLYRTRIREGMAQGPDFAGHLAVIQFGCGTGCSIIHVGDLRSGRVYRFPLGEAAIELGYRKDSRLIAAQWQDYASGTCWRDRYLWTGKGFERLSRTDLGPVDLCWEND